MKEILFLHNSFRDKIASGAELEKFNFPASSDMLVMSWSPELAEIAQKHANRCLFEHDCNDCRRIDEYSVGQNLYQIRRSYWRQNRHFAANWSRAITAWYDEISFAPPSIVKSFVGGAYGHFSQVVWSSSYKIGCGYATFDVVDTNTETGSRITIKEELYTCNYGPTGNIRHERMYRKTRGKPASKCPFGSSSSKNNNNSSSDVQFKNLCFIENQSKGVLNFNESALKEESVFYCDFSDATKMNDTLTSVCGLKIKINDDNNNSTANIIKTASSFNYLSFITRNPSSLSFEFPSEYSSPKGLCIQSLQRKGSNDVRKTSESSSEVSVKLVVKELNNWSTTVGSFGGKDTNDWTTSSVNINWSYKTRIIVTFDVKDKNESFYEIKRLVIKKGRCS